MDEPKFLITPCKDTSDVWSIKDFDKVCEAMDKYLSTMPLKLVATKVADYEYIKRCRTEIRNKAKLIKDTRLSINEVFLGKYNQQCKQLEDKLKQADEILKEKKEDFEEEILLKPVKRTYLVNIKLFDHLAFAKLCQLLDDNKIEYTTNQDNK